MFRGERAPWPPSAAASPAGPQIKRQKFPSSKTPLDLRGERGGRSESCSFGCLQIPSAWPGCSVSLPGHQAGNPSGNPPGDPAQPQIQKTPPLPLCTQLFQQNSWSLQRYFPLLILQLGVIHHTCYPFSSY